MPYCTSPLDCRTGGLLIGLQNGSASLVELSFYQGLRGKIPYRRTILRAIRSDMITDWPQQPLSQRSTAAPTTSLTRGTQKGT